MDSVISWVESTVTAHLRRRLSVVMPAGPGREMALWSLESGNPRRAEYLQRMGVLQLNQLERALLVGLVAPSEWPALARGSAELKAYLTCEVISDNLALGLGRPRGDGDDADADATARRAVLRRFNAAALMALAGEPRAEWMKRFEGARGQCATISTYRQSLCEASMRALGERFYRARSSCYTPEEIEYAAFPALIANVALARSVSDETCTQLGGGLVTRGLTARYAAVDRLLGGVSMSLEARVENGADAILVAPTLARYLLLLEELNPAPGWGRVAESAALESALNLASLLVRLTNDLGALVLEAPRAREELLRGVEGALARRAEDSRGLERELLRRANAGDARLTRLAKDIEHAEFNVVLDGLGRSSDARSFRARVDHCAVMYAEGRVRLAAALKVLCARGLPARASILIDRFVGFHEHLYTRAYGSRGGEYAV
jgi:hypothetical protein